MPEKPDIGKLVALMARLRSPDGCPWDKEQTLKTLVPFIIEEAYEVISAIDSGHHQSVKEELGDLLFQIIFACRIMEEEGAFGMAEVIDESHAKMVRRHPHVFGDREAEKAGTPEEVLKRWAEIKKEEKKGLHPKPEGYLSGIPEAFPALLRAHKVSQKAARAGFDWKDVSGVLEKVTEELDEFKDAVRSRDSGGMEEEIGDLLFTIVNVSRFFEVNPEDALRKTIGKFITRFHYIEKKLAESGTDFSTASLDQMDRLWEAAKDEGKKKTVKIPE